MSDEWVDIARADYPGLENVRRIDPNHPLDFFRGRDFYGRYLLLLTGRAIRSDLPRAPTLAGIEITLAEPEAGICSLVLTLLDTEQFEIFRALCANLIAATNGLSRGDHGQGIRIVLNCLRRWQALLRRRSDDLLTRQEIIGLMGELFFLRDRLLCRMSAIDAINSWRGPCGDEQDFVVGEWTIEIKSQLSTAGHCLQISSEHQLDTVSGPIMLCHHVLGLSDSTDTRSRTLNAMVQELIDYLSSQSVSAADTFLMRLVEAGYRNRPEYDEESWLLTGTGFYEIVDSFPRIVSSSVSKGVECVRYNIRFDACKPFRSTDNEALGKIFGHAT